MFANKAGSQLQRLNSTFLCPLWGRGTVGGRKITIKSELDDAMAHGTKDAEVARTHLVSWCCVVLFV